MITRAYFAYGEVVDMDEKVSCSFMFTSFFPKSATQIYSAAANNLGTFVSEKNKGKSIFLTSLTRIR